MPITPFLLAAALGATDERTDAAVVFGAPEELTTAGEAFTGILYPSPVLHDVDGDGQRELLIGDLPGRILVSEPTSETQGVAWSEQKSLEVDGEPIRLNNW